MTELETRCAQALDALTERLERMTKLYQDVSYQLLNLKGEHEATLSRIAAFEHELQRLEKALKRFQELS